MNFQPYPTRSGLVALGVAFLLGAGALSLINLLPRQASLPDTFRLLLGLLVVLAALGLVLYWAVIALKLGYYLSRNGLVIYWGTAQQFVPFDRIQAVIAGRDLAALLKFRGLNAAGLRLGWGEIEGYGPLHFHATAPLADSLLVVTASRVYVISPRQPDKFIKAWRDRQNLGPTQEWAVELQRNWPFDTPFFADPITRGLLSVAVLACVALFGYLALMLPQLPHALPIHFDAYGHADRIADKSMLLTLPTMGAAFLAANVILGSAIYRWERVASYLLWTGSIALQVCLWVAVISITA